MAVTDEKVHNSKMLKKFVDDVLKAISPDKKNILKKQKLVLLADGAYDTNTNFDYLDKNGITPGIKVRRKNSIVPLKIRLRNIVSKVTD